MAATTVASRELASANRYSRWCPAIRRRLSIRENSESNISIHNQCNQSGFLFEQIPGGRPLCYAWISYRLVSVGCAMLLPLMPWVFLSLLQSHHYLTSPSEKRPNPESIFLYMSCRITVSIVMPCLKGSLTSFNGQCHEIENGYNWYQMTDQKNLVMPKQIFNYFQHLCMF